MCNHSRLVAKSKMIVLLIRIKYQFSHSHTAMSYYQKLELVYTKCNFQ